MIVNSPIAYLNSMPEDLKARIRTAFLDAPKKAKVAFDKLSDGKNDPWETVDHKAYEPIVELNKFVDSLRKQ
jgi:phosphonate transport system substrate-binding protein